MHQGDQVQGDKAAGAAHVPLKHITYQVCALHACCQSVVGGSVSRALVNNKAAHQSTKTCAGCATGAGR